MLEEQWAGSGAGVKPEGETVEVRQLEINLS